jgi:ABC-type transporter Mla subunit MlaD
MGRNRMFIAVLAIFFGHLAQGASAESSLKYVQNTPSAQPSPPATATTPELGMAKEVDELQKFLEQRRQRLDKLDEDIRRGLQTEQQATDIYDRMISSFKELIDKIGPDSDYRKRLDEIVKRSNQNAKEFATSQDPKIRDLVKKNNETAAMTEKLINETNAEYARGLETLSNLEKGKALAVAKIKTDGLRDAANAAKDYLDVVRGAIDKMESFNKHVGETAPGS